MFQDVLHGIGMQNAIYEEGQKNANCYYLKGQEPQAKPFSERIDLPI